MVFDRSIKSSAVKVEEEQIGNYNCVHAQIISMRNMCPLVNKVDTIDT
ncbi:hypothetical protein [Mucilaginibacter sp.]